MDVTPAAYLDFAYPTHLLSRATNFDPRLGGAGQDIGHYLAVTTFRRVDQHAGQQEFGPQVQKRGGFDLVHPRDPQALKKRGAAVK